MQRDKHKIESSLKSKGFKQDNRDHHYFLYLTLEGKLTPIKTKTSLGSSKMKSIGDHLLGLMAKQCCLDKPQFINLIDCPLNQLEYESILKNKGKM